MYTCTRTHTHTQQQKNSPPPKLSSAPPASDSAAPPSWSPALCKLLSPSSSIVCWRWDRTSFMFEASFSSLVRWLELSWSSRRRCEFSVLSDSTCLSKWLYEDKAIAQLSSRWCLISALGKAHTRSTLALSLRGFPNVVALALGSKRQSKRQSAKWLIAALCLRGVSQADHSLEKKKKYYMILINDGPFFTLV